jgi:hypothetical protein
VKEFESIAYRLGQLDENEKRQLAAFTQAEADGASSVEYREFLRQFPKAMGLRCPGTREANRARFARLSPMASPALGAPALMF